MKLREKAATFLCLLFEKGQINKKRNSNTGLKIRTPDAK